MSSVEKYKHILSGYSEYYNGYKNMFTGLLADLDKMVANDPLKRTPEKLFEIYNLVLMSPIDDDSDSYRFGAINTLLAQSIWRYKKKFKTYLICDICGGFIESVNNNQISNVLRGSNAYCSETCKAERRRKQVKMKQEKI